MTSKDTSQHQTIQKVCHYIKNYTNYITMVHVSEWFNLSNVRLPVNNYPTCITKLYFRFLRMRQHVYGWSGCYKDIAADKHAVFARVFAHLSITDFSN